MTNDKQKDCIILANIVAKIIKSLMNTFDCIDYLRNTAEPIFLENLLVLEPVNGVSEFLEDKAPSIEFNLTEIAGAIKDINKNCWLLVYHSSSTETNRYYAVLFHNNTCVNYWQIKN